MNFSIFRKLKPLWLCLFIIFILTAVVLLSIWYRSEVPNTTKLNASLVILVHSGPVHFLQRSVIRSTWLSAIPNDTLAFFVVGTKNLSTETIKSLQDEQDTHKDLIILDIEDAYEKLTTKVLHGFVWLNDHVNFKYVLKTDDDSFVRVDLLYGEATRLKPQRLYWGYFDGLNYEKDEKYPVWLLCDTFLPYAKGGGYVLSADLIEFITKNAHHLMIHHAEDVSVGVWTAPLKVQRIHDRRFDTEYLSRGCSNKYLITHKQDIHMMKEKHEHIQQTGELCSFQIQFITSYLYDWSGLPSKCCIRRVNIDLY